MVRVEMNRCDDKVIMPVRARTFIGRGTVVHIHDINGMAGLPVGCTDLFSAVDRIQYQDLHIKKSEE